MSIRFKIKGKYYYISFASLFPAIMICMCVIVFFATLFPTYCLIVAGLIIAIGSLLFLSRKGTAKEPSRTSLKENSQYQHQSGKEDLPGIDRKNIGTGK
jgi:hypothetical protein